MYYPKICCAIIQYGMYNPWIDFLSQQYEIAKNKQEGPYETAF